MRGGSVDDDDVQLPPEHPTLIFDEEYGTRIARLLGLTGHPAWLADFGGVPGLVIERYDRSDGGRIHQEDFNQVLGARGDQKYQAIGGQVSLRRIAQVFAARGDRAGLGRLLDQLTVAVAVGNLDWHAMCTVRRRRLSARAGWTAVGRRAPARPPGRRG